MCVCEWERSRQTYRLRMRAYFILGDLVSFASHFLNVVLHEFFVQSVALSVELFYKNETHGGPCAHSSVCLLTL